MEIIHTQIDREREQIERAKDDDYKRYIFKRFANQSVIRSARISAARSKTASWLANAFSFLLAIYAVYYYAEMYAGWKFYALMAIGVFVLAIWEISKRLSSISFFEGFYNQAERDKMWAGVLLFALVAGSMAATYQGGSRLITEETSGPKLVHNTRIDSLSVLIAKAERDQQLMKNQTWRGKIVSDARKQIAALQKRTDLLIAQRLELENKDADENEGLGSEHESKMANLGIVFGGLGAIADIILIGLLGFAERKEWEVFCLSRSGANGTADGTVKNDSANRSGNRSSRSVPEPTRQAKPAAQVAAAKPPIGFTLRTDASAGTNKRTCSNCGTDISHRRSDAKYCSPTCRKENWEAKNNG